MVTWATLWQWAHFPKPPNFAPGEAVELGDEAVLTSLKLKYKPVVLNPKE